jgi:hypothetical protein
MDVIYINGNGHLKSVESSLNASSDAYEVSINEPNFIICLMLDSKRVVSNVLNSLESYFCTLNYVNLPNVHSSQYSPSGRFLEIPVSQIVNLSCCCNNSESEASTAPPLSVLLSDAYDLCNSGTPSNYVNRYYWANNGEQYPSVGVKLYSDEALTNVAPVLSGQERAYLGSGRTAVPVPIRTDVNGIVVPATC